jgi:hypothetical protein
MQLTNALLGLLVAVSGASATVTLGSLDYLANKPDQFWRTDYGTLRPM